MTDITDAVTGPETPPDSPAPEPRRHNSFSLDMVPNAQLLRLRDHMGWNQRELAEALGVNRSTLSNYLTGSECPRTVALAAEALLRRQGAGARPKYAILTFGPAADVETIRKVVDSLGGRVALIEEYGN